VYASLVWLSLITLCYSNILCLYILYFIYIICQGLGYATAYTPVHLFNFQSFLAHYALYSAYQEYGAELRILSPEPLQTECPKIIYLVRSQLSFMKFIASQIKNDEPKGLQREYFLYFVPRRTVACEKVSVILFMFELIH